MATHTILVCTVGGSPTPVITACIGNAPDHVFFVCSSGDARHGSCAGITGATSRVFAATCPHCGEGFTTTAEHEPLVRAAGLEDDHFEIRAVDDPDDLGDLLAVCAGIGHEIRRRWSGREVRVVANYTGGTKTMALALGLHALRAGWELQVATTSGGGRPNLMRIEGGEVLRGQGPRAVE